MAKKGGKLRAVYGVFFALLTLFVGALFIMQTWSIYRSAPDSPYTTENIRKHFQEIALPVWTLLGALAVNILLAILLPEGKGRVKATVNVKKSLQKVKGRVPTEGALFDEAYAVSRRSRAFRAFVWALTALFMLCATALCALTLFGIYYRPLINKPFFAEQKGLVDKIVQTAALSVLALIVASLAAGLLSLSRKREQKKYLAIIARSKQPVKEATAPVEERAEEPVLPVQVVEEPKAAKGSQALPTWKEIIRKIVGMLYLGEKVTQAEIDSDIARLLKEQEGGLPVAEEMPAVELPVPSQPVVKKEERKKTVVKKEKAKKPLVKAKKEKKSHPKARKAGLILARVGIGAAAVALLAFGVYDGGMKDVLLKAINICTQCIGLG